MAEEVEIKFEDIKAGDLIRTVRTVGAVTHTMQGIALDQDSDGDWLNDDELLTYHDIYDETYFRLPLQLPVVPGSLISFPSVQEGAADAFALKLYGDDGWFVSFSDGSSAIFGDQTVAKKGWTLLR
jgi:hypothetical protein